MQFEPIPDVPEETARIAYSAFPKKNARREYIDEVGKHRFELLKAIAASDSERLKNLRQVKLLKQMWDQQLEIKEMAGRVIRGTRRTEVFRKDEISRIKP